MQFCLGVRIYVKDRVKGWSEKAIHPHVSTVLYNTNCIFCKTDPTTVVRTKNIDSLHRFPRYSSV